VADPAEKRGRSMRVIPCPKRFKFMEEKEGVAWSFCDIPTKAPQTHH